MPTGKYSLNDIQAPAQQQGAYSLSDIAQPVSQPIQQFGSQNTDQILRQQAGFNPDAPLPSATSRALGGAWQGIKDAASGLYNTVAHPKETAAGMLFNTIGVLGDAQQAGKLGDVYRKQEDYVKAIPFFGQMADDAAKHVAAGDYAGPAARIATSTAANAAIPKVVGGALGSALNIGGRGAELAAATPETQNLAFTRTIVPGKASDLLTRALKPPVTSPDFEGSVNASLPEIAKQRPAPGVKGFADAVEQAKQGVNAKYQGWKAPVANTRIDTTPMVAKQVASIPAMNLFENPGIVGDTERAASAYDMTPKTVTTTSPLLDQFGKPMTTTQTVTPQQPLLSTVDNIRKDTNAKLTSFWNKGGGDRNAARSNPNVARTEAVNRGAADLVYKAISDKQGVPEADIRANQDLYGALSDVGDVAGKRATVTARQNPLSFQETLAATPGHPVAGTINFLGQRILKNATGSDALVNSALDRFNNPERTGLQSRSGILPKAVTASGRGAQKLGDVIKKSSRNIGAKAHIASVLYGTGAANRGR